MGDNPKDYDQGRIEGKLDLLLEHHDRLHKEQKDFNAKLLAIEKTKADKDDIEHLESRLSTVESFKSRIVGAVSLISLIAGGAIAAFFKKVTGV